MPPIERVYLRCGEHVKNNTGSKRSQYRSHEPLDVTYSICKLFAPRWPRQGEL